MITEDYVSFKTAKLLKKKGLDDEYTNAFYDKNGKLYFIEILSDLSSHPNNDTDIAASTLYIAMKWLREVHGLCLFLIPAVVDEMLRPGYAIYPKCDNKWEWCASKNDGSKATFGCDINKDYCDSYEQACEAAIKYCLEKLI